MPTKKIFHHPLLILIFIALLLGLYRAVVLGCISNDSVTFLEYAQQLDTSPADVIKTHYQHPGFPALILMAEKVMTWLDGPLSVHQKVIAGQAVNLLCRILAIACLYPVFHRFGSQRTAFLNTLLVILIPVYADNGSDVLSDWPNLMLMTVAFFCCLKALPKAHPGWFVSAGAASGLAYWMRPEGLFLCVVMGVYTLIHLFYAGQKIKWLLGLFAMLIPAALIVAPYMLYKGQLFPKNDIGTLPKFSEQTLENTVQNHHLDTYAAIPESANVIRYGQGALHFFEKTFNTVYLLIIPLCVVVSHRLRRFRYLVPRERFLLFFVSLWLLMMLWLYGRTGYMSHRHIMPLLVFSSAWLYQGLLLIALFLWKTTRRVHRHACILLVICAAVFVPKLVCPTRTDKIAYKQAGLWLAANTDKDVQIAAFDNRVGYYAQRGYRRIRRRRPKGDYLVIETDDKDVNIPPRAIRLKTGDAVIDEAIAIYALRSHQE